MRFDTDYANKFYEVVNKRFEQKLASEYTKEEVAAMSYTEKALIRQRIIEALHSENTVKTLGAAKFNPVTGEFEPIEIK